MGAFFLPVVAGGGAAAQVRFHHARVVPHLVRLALGDQAAVVQHGDAVAQAHHQLHVVFDQQHGAALLADARINVVLLGPGNGIGVPTRLRVVAALTAGKSCVLDADALSSFADDPAHLFRAIRRAGGRAILTPHDGEFARLLDEIITPDVFAAAKILRNLNAFTRDDGTPLNYALVNLKDWCKNDFEVINQLRINTEYSHHRYDVILLISGVPVMQIELKSLGINPRRAMEQIVEYKNDPGNGYTRTLLCFIQLFAVSNRDRTYYFANNNARHFAFNAEERFLPIYEFAGEENKKITHLDDFAKGFLSKCDLGRTISRYMVLLAAEQKLMMMRPYQVYAVQHLVRCIDDNNGNVAPVMPSPATFTGTARNKYQFKINGGQGQQAYRAAQIGRAHV